MRSLQDYIDIYTNITTKLNLQGDSAEVLIQMLANASYINEVENVSYVQEASLEKATLLNSKIQHCIDEMYSVFRGTCPRVVINFKPTKYFSFDLFDEITSSNSFKVYYVGYYKKIDETNYEFEPSPIVIPPNVIGDNTNYIIVGMLAKETVLKEWALNQSNTYYVDCLEDNLSNDMWAKVDSNYVNTTREFSSHVLNGEIFDLTLPSFGSRLYVADIIKTTNNSENLVPSNTAIEALYYKYTTLDEYNESELTKLTIKGAELVDLELTNLSLSDINIKTTGLYYIPEGTRNDLNTIHYKANKDRYVSTILRSNSDIGVVLEKMYPEKVKSSGTSYEFEVIGDTSALDIYYVPLIKSNLLTDTEINEFISSRLAYYVTDTVNVQKGLQYTAVFNIDLELFQNNNVDSEIKDILSNYQDKFNISLEDSTEDIKSLISKISNVKRIINMSIIYIREDGVQLTTEEVKSIKLVKSYFQINYVINSIIQS